MFYNYVALVLFFAIGLSIPTSLVFLSRLLGGRHDSPNPVKNSPWESAEVSVGSNRDVDNEYLPYFMVFLPFEIVVAMLLLWSTSAGFAASGTNAGFILIGAASGLAGVVGYKFAGARFD